MAAGFYVSVHATTNTLNVVSGSVETGSPWSNATIYANEEYFNTSIKSINSSASYTITKGTAATDPSPTTSLNDGKCWVTMNWSGYRTGLANGTYVVSYDLGGLYDISRVDVFEMGSGISGVSVKAGTTKDAMTDVTVSTAVVNGDPTIDATHHTGARATVATFASKARNVQYVDVTLTVADSANLTEVMIFGDISAQPLKLVSGKAVTNTSGQYGNIQVYENYLNSTIEVLSSAATYSWASETGITDTQKMTDGQTWSPSNYGNGLWLTDATLEKVDIH